jgi:predicted thioesterase
MEQQIAVGKSASATATVDSTNTAKAFKSGGLDVFATPAMIALMEQAACKVLDGVLGEGETSVGTQVNVSHDAASPIGAVITATATVTAVSSRRVEFDVTAVDGSGAIGGGTHSRVIVSEDRFMSKVNAKLA